MALITGFEDLLEQGAGEVKWTVEQSVDLAQKMEAVIAPIGYHVGLTGSVLFKGSSKKDADFILYPHDPKNNLCTPEQLFDALRVLGFHNPYPTCEEYVNRTVWLCKNSDGRRVDLFFF